MKKAIVITLCAVIVISALLFGSLMYNEVKAKYLFEDMESSNIERMIIISGDNSYPLDTAETEDAVTYLRQIPVHQKSTVDSDPSIKLKIVFSDSTEQEIGWYDNYLFVDGICYKSDLELCGPLNSHCSKIINEYEDKTPKSPFKTLKVEDISSITEIYYYKTRELNAEQIKYIVERLNNLWVYERTDATQVLYGGSNAHFRVELKKGEIINVYASNSHVHIGEKRYSGEYMRLVALIEDYWEYWGEPGVVYY